MITELIPQSKMTRNLWIAYKWVDVRGAMDIEAQYSCAGLRDISESVTAAASFDIWLETMKNIEVLQKAYAQKK